MRTRAFICLLFALPLLVTSCRSGPQEKKSTSAAGRDNMTMPHLIADYTGMKEDALISAAWIDTGFSLAEYAGATVQPVENYSRIDYPEAQKRIEQALQAAVADKVKNATGQTLAIAAAITGMRGKPSLLKRFNPSYEDTPSIEVEIVITEAQSKRQLVKLCHMARAEDLPKALDSLTREITEYFQKKL